MVFISREVVKTKIKKENHSPIPGEENVGKIMNLEELKELIEKFKEAQVSESEWPVDHSYQIKTLTSLKEGVEQWGALTPKQQVLAENLKGDLIPTEEFKTWAKVYRENHQEISEYIARYYEGSKMPYFGHITAAILNDPKFIPTRKQYDKFITNNRYSARVISEMFDKEPKFEIGETVQMRGASNIKKYHRVESGYWQEPTPGWCYFVIKNDLIPVNSCIGCRRYELLPFGDGKILKIEERKMKKARI